MKLLKTLKILALIGFITLGFNGSQLLGGTCTGIATACGATCVAVAPPGGTSQCMEDPFIVLCIAWDANGNIVAHSSARCRPTPC